MDPKNPYTDPYAPLSNTMGAATPDYFNPPDQQSQAYAQAQPQPQKQAPTKAPPPPPAQPQQQGGGLLDKWNEFMDHPEHRAGMMQFAVNMLSGRGFGESLGAAAEATGRNVSAQQAQQQAEEELGLKERGVAAKEKEAAAYAAQQGKGDPLERQMRMSIFRDELAAKKAAFHDFNSWLLHPTDLLSDTSMDYIKSRYPTVQSKSQLIRPKTPEEKAARADIESLFNRTGGGGETSAAPAQAEIPPKPKNVPDAKLMNVNGRPVWYDPRTKLPAQ